MNTHLAGNDLLREVFQMGPPPLLRVESKAHKLDRVRGCEGVVKIVSGTVEPRLSGHLGSRSRPDK